MTHWTYPYLSSRSPENLRFSIVSRDYQGLCACENSVTSNTFTMSRAVTMKSAASATSSGRIQSGLGSPLGFTSGVSTTPGQSNPTEIFDPEPCSCRATDSVMPRTAYLLAL